MAEPRRKQRNPHQTTKNHRNWINHSGEGIKVKTRLLLLTAFLVGLSLVPCQAAEVTVSDVDGLVAAINDANNGGAGTTILVNDGVYTLT